MYLHAEVRSSATARAFPVSAPERTLIGRAQAGDIAARSTLVHSHTRLVASIASEYRHLDVEMAELRQSGVVGLLIAIARFDVGRGTRLSTYAVPWIRHSVLQSIESQRRGPRLPSTAQKALRELKQAEDRLSVTLGRHPSVAELAREIGTSSGRVLSLLDARSHPAALDADPDGDGSLGDSLTAPCPEPLDDLEQHEEVKTIRRALASLPPRHRTVVQLRYREQLTAAAAARRLGISSTRVAQLEQEAFGRLAPQLEPVR